jgi:hypothetical protein
VLGFRSDLQIGRTGAGHGECIDVGIGLSPMIYAQLTWCILQGDVYLILRSGSSASI